MKKLLAMSLLVGAGMFAVPSTEASAATAVNADPQIRVQIGGNQRNRRFNNRTRRVVTTTRITGFGRNRYRETIRTTYLPNGRTRVEVISRTRVGGRNW
jgi:hypothetical protein